MSISDWPVNEKPREKLLQKGAASLSDAELLAIFFRTGTKGKSAVDLARQLLRENGDLRGVFEADLQRFCLIPGLGASKFVTVKASQELAQRYLECQLRRTEPLSNPELTRDYLKARLRPYPHEVFACLFLDNRHRVICFEELFSGTIDSASVYPREVIKRALFHNAAALILAHNHPSGVAEPSQADQRITARLKQGLELIDIRLLDHFVIGDGKAVSLAERGLL